MKLRRLSCIALSCTLGLVVVALFGPYAEGDEKADPAARAAEEMALWMEANRIGVEHEALQKNVGTWDVEGLFWMVPGSPAVESKGKSEIRSMLGGRFIQEHYTTDFMGQPFEGIGTTGYDTMKGIYLSTWMDSMSNFIMQQEGLAADSGDTITYYGGHDKPGGGAVKTKMVHRVTGPDTRELTAYELLGDGTERKTMALRYARRK